MAENLDEVVHLSIPPLPKPHLRMLLRQSFKPLPLPLFVVRPLALLFALLVVVLSAHVEKLLVFLHEQLECVIDETMNRSKK